MTKLLDQAIAEIRKLPAPAQDQAAEMLLSIAARQDEPVRLDEDTRAAVHRGDEQAKRGEFAPDEEMAAFFKRHRG